MTGALLGRIPLSIKLGMSFLTLMIIPVAVMTMETLFHSSRYETRLAAEAELRGLVADAGRVEQVLREPVSDILFLQGSVAMRRYLAICQRGGASTPPPLPAHAQPITGLRAPLRAFLARSPLPYAAAWILDINGAPLLKVAASNNEKPLDAFPREALAKKVEEEIRQLAKVHADSMHLSAIRGRSVPVHIEMDEREGMAARRLYYGVLLRTDEGAIAGTMVLSLRVHDLLASVLRELGRTQVCALDQHNAMLYCGTDATSREPRHGSTAALCRFARGPNLVKDLTRLEEGYVVGPKEAEDSAFFHARIQPAGQAAVRWVLLGTRHRDALQSGVGHSRRAILVAALGSLLLAAAMMILITRATIRPLRALATATARIGPDNWRPALPEAAGTDEVAELTRGFRAMAERLAQAHEEQRQILENLRITLDSIGDGVISINRAGRVTRINPVAEALTGWTTAAAHGRPLAEIYNARTLREEPVTVLPALTALAEGRVVARSEPILLTARDGETRRVSDSAAPLRSPEGAVLGAVMVARDVTEESSLQEQLRQDQKMKAIGQLAGGVAHDFNNMLGGILGSADLLQRRLGEDERSRYLLYLIQESATRAADLTAKLLAFARKQPASTATIDVHRILRDTVAILETTIDRRLRIEPHLEASDGLVLGDGPLLQSAFLNLGINASHAIAEQGVIAFATRDRELDERHCQRSAFDLVPGPYLEVEVRDDGCGISPEHLERIFEPFFTTKEQGKGTGMGLAAVFGTVQQHHGEIEVRSSPGQGTAIRVRLPRAAEALQAELAAGREIHGSGRVLVVDDEAVIRATAKSMLEGLGYTVLLAANGREAVDTLAREEGGVDAVLLDMIMPEMGGRECFRALRKQAPNLPIILSSGFVQAEDLKTLKAEGLAGYLRKPFASPGLSQALHEALAARAPGPAHPRAEGAEGAESTGEADPGEAVGANPARRPGDDSTDSRLEESGG